MTSILRGGMAEKHKSTVAVIGLGACGLVTLKNLLEAGFHATGFEENDYVGGLWQYTEDPTKASVLTSTIANLSKELGCFTDFPFSSHVNDFPTAAQTAQYLNDYAEKFDLRPHMRLNTKLKSVTRESAQWRLELMSRTDQEAISLPFDRVAICTGLNVQIPKMPKVKGLNTFTGQAIHSNSYKKSSDYAGKRVLVVGLGNSGPDIAVDLISNASQVWLSYRQGNAIFARRDTNSKPRDHVLSLRITKMGGVFNKYFPTLAGKLALLGMKRRQDQSFTIDPEWKLGIPQPPTRKRATMSDELVPAIRDGKICLKPALVEVSGSTAMFADSSRLEDIDTIICGTGFSSDFSYIDRDADPTRETRKDWAGLPGADGRPLPRLYQGIFSLDFPESLCFLGNSPLTPQAFLNFDISSAAVAQVWAGNSPLPSIDAMKAEVDTQHEEACKLASTGELANTNIRNNWDWFKWCDNAAGLGIVKRIGYGISGWSFWLQDMKLCKLVTDGLMSPHLFRLFDEGKRRPWMDARETVQNVNLKK